MDSIIPRINELAKKQRECGLTDAEKEEQKALRAQYLANFRKNFSQQLNNTYFVDGEGHETPLTKFKKKK